MKLNLIRNGVGILTGYMNVDPIGNYNDGRYEVACEPYNRLDNIVDDNECMEIIANDVLDFIEPADIEGTVLHWVSKIRVGGTLTICGVDFLEVARSLVYGKFTDDKGNTLPFIEQLESANLILHNSKGDVWNRRQYNTSLEYVLKLLSQVAGFKVIQRAVFDHRYYVKVVREA